MTKTIFHPGKALTSQWLNSSQYLGPSNPGVVFVPNPVNDWEYPLLTGASFDLPNLQQYFVTRTANQAVDGVKTFTSIPEFPASTQLTGNQGVNTSRLSADLNELNTTISDQIVTTNTALTAQLTAFNTTLTGQIVTTNTALTAQIAAVSNNLATSYVNLATSQTVTGLKIFDNIEVPSSPAGLNSPISNSNFLSRAVILTTNQTIAGTKTFSSSPKVPNPVSGLDAVNIQTLLSQIGALTDVNTNSSSYIVIGNLKILFGQTAITGSWTAGGQLTATQSIASSNMTSIITVYASINRLVFLSTAANLTDINFIGDGASGIPNANNGLISWLVIGT